MGNKFWNSLLLISTLGIGLLYVFILLAISKFGSVEVYNIDPKNVFESNFYYISYFFHFLGMLILFALSILFLGYFILKRRLLFSKQVSIFLLVLIVINIVTMKIDVGNYLNWFFD